MDCRLSCVVLFIFRSPTNSSHGSRDWWRVFIFAFIACTRAWCLHCLSSFFYHLSTILRCSCLCNSFLSLFIDVNLLLGFVCCSLTCFVWIDLIILEIQLHWHACNTFQHIKEKQKKNWWLVYSSTSNNDNPNNFKNREPTYVTIKKIKSFQIKSFEVMHVH